MIVQGQNHFLSTRHALVLLIVVVLFSGLLLPLNSVDRHTDAASLQHSLLTSSNFAHSPGALPTSTSDKNQTSIPTPNYDEQLGLSFTQSFVSLTYNVTAISQTDSNGYGPAYLLNGITDLGYWYQVGIAYDWPQNNGGYVAGFNFVYEVFGADGKSLYPNSTSAGLSSFFVKPGDSVELSLFFSGGNVIMYAKDWYTSAVVTQSYTAHGASSFTGTLAQPSDSNGFFTGLMTEWYHVNPYYGGELKVTYSDKTLVKTAAWMWIDEYNPSNSSWAGFGGSTPGPVSYTSNPSQFKTFSLKGATESSNASMFITGGQIPVALTLSYSVMGGGSGYSPPTLTYVSNSFEQNVTLSTSPTIYYVDSGTTWSVTTLLDGSSSTERWVADQTTARNATENVTTNFVFYHQYLVRFNYSLAGGGNGFTPTITAVEFSSNISAVIGQPIWLDSGTPYSYSIPLSSNTTERWDAAGSAKGEILSSGNIDPTYYHQFSINAMFSISNIGAPTTGPELKFQSFGVAQNSILTETPTIFWADAGSTYNVSSTILGSSGERWITNTTTVGNVSSSILLKPTFTHQYYVTVNLSEQSAGTVNPQNEWVNAGDKVSISSSTNPGWKFETWNGIGPGSYTGTANTMTIIVQGPIVENSTFYAGLKVVISGPGKVSYSFGSTSSSVTQTDIVYVPAGTTVSLKANPASFFDRMESWSGGVSGFNSQTTLVVLSPTTVEAQFGINFIIVGVLAVVVVAVIAAIVSLSRRRPKLNPAT